MGVQSNAEGVLVVHNSTVWLSAVFAVIGAILIYAAFASGDNRLFRPALFVGVFAVVFLNKSTFVFDSTQRTVRWQIMRFGWRSAGSLPFDTIKDVVLQSAPGRSGRFTYRLAMLTAEGPMPLSSGYGDNSERCLARQSQILQLVRPGQATAATAPPTSIAASMDSSIRTMVAQGRKIDAIKLLTSMGMNLTEAKQRVDEIEKMQVG
jgi:hypothetical protein